MAGLLNDDPLVMRKHCGDCAFVAGTEAHNCEITQLTANICVDSSEPFYCHRANDDHSELVPRLDHRGEPVLCRGFVDALQDRGPVPEWSKAIARECLRMLQDAQAGRMVSEDSMLGRIIEAGERAQMASEI